MREIVLTQGKIALVDDEDFERVNQYKWYAHKAELKRGVTFYAHRNIYLEKGRRATQPMHRFIMDAPDGVQVDHEDHNGLNNQKCNIRLATQNQNQHNQERHLTRNGKSVTSQYKGVHWDKSGRSLKKWRASIRINGKQIQLGRFKIEIEAAKKYDEAAILYHGEFAKLNFGG